MKVRKIKKRYTGKILTIKIGETTLLCRLANKDGWLIVINKVAFVQQSPKSISNILTERLQ